MYVSHMCTYIHIWTYAIYLHVYVFVYWPYLHIYAYLYVYLTYGLYTYVCASWKCETQNEFGSVVKHRHESKPA